MISFLSSYHEISLPLNIFLFFSIFFLNFLIPILIANKFKLNLQVPIILVSANFIFYLIYLIFVEFTGSDGLSFFNEKLQNNIYPFYIRDNFIIKLSLTFRDLKIHFLIVTLFTNILSAVSFLLIYIKLKENEIITNFTYFFIFFMVCISGVLFWSNGLLKDNFVLFAVTLFLFSVNSNSINFKILVPAIIICLIIRPLIGFFILLSLFIFYNIYLLLKKNLSGILKINFFSLIPLFILINFILSQYSLTFDLTIFQQILDEVFVLSNSFKDPNFADGYLTYDTSKLAFYELYFIYYFGPLIPLSPLYLFAFISLQNLANLLILIVFIFNIIFNFRKFKEFLIFSKFQTIFFLYSILYTLIVPLTCYNLGIAFRQKWMCLIILIYIMLFFISYCRRKKI